MIVWCLFSVFIQKKIKIDLVGEWSFSLSKSKNNLHGANLYWLDFEMQSDQREHQTLQILYQIVETAQTFGIFGLINID